MSVFDTVRIMQPDQVTPDAFAGALTQLHKKKGSQPAFFTRLRLARFHEGLSVQAMHIGPYATEPETFLKM